MENFELLIDTWEGQLEIDEAKLKDGGVAGIISRINSTAGGHHKDDNFDKQWAESAGFIRFPYFVYTPWQSGKANFEWLMANLPKESTIVSADIEIRRTDYSPSSYAYEVSNFLDLLKRETRVIVYTGAWFLSYLSYWPADVDYWWAQYPYYFWYENQTTTWDRVKSEAVKLKWPPYNASQCPGRIALWQCSGDKLTLPGTNRSIDVNLWNGTLKELALYTGQSVPVHTPTQEERLVRLEKYLDWAKEELKKYNVEVPEL